MNKREAILFLEKKRDKAIGDMNFYGEGSRKGVMNEIRVNTYDIAINTLQQIDEPQAEKVEVSQEFADWVEKAKAIKGIADYKSWCVKEIADMGWGNWIHDPDRFADKEKIYDKWVNTVHENKEKHIKAIYDGYTGNPKRWVVRQGGSEVWYLQGFRNSLDGDIVKQWCSHEGCIKFTDRAKAEAVATLVDGSVEEV